MIFDSSSRNSLSRLINYYHIWKAVDEFSSLTGAVKRPYGIVAGATHDGTNPNKVPASIMIGLSVYWWGTAVFWFVILIVLLPSQIRVIVGDERKGSVLGVICLCAALFSVHNPNPNPVFSLSVADPNPNFSFSRHIFCCCGPRPLH